MKLQSQNVIFLYYRKDNNLTNKCVTGCDIIYIYIYIYIYVYIYMYIYIYIYIYIIYIAGLGTHNSRLQTNKNKD